MDLDALLEAERRGILPADKAPLLQEARRRGLVPGGSTPSPQPNPDGTYGEPPEGMIANPYTGQMTERALLAENQRQNNPPNKADSFVRGASRGISYGGMDETVGGLNALIPGAGTMGERYAYGREQNRAQEKVAQEANPNTFMAGEITGATVPALATAPLAAAPTMMRTVGRGAALGGIEGAIYGGLTGEGGASNRVDSAQTYGALGAGIGAAAPMAMRGASKVTQGVVDPIMSAVNAGNQGRANKAMSATLRESGQSVDDLARATSRAAQQGQPEFRAMDALGTAGQRRASGITRSGGDASTALAEFLEQRQLGQGPRVAQFTDEAFGMGGRTANQIQEGMKAARSQAADAAYDAARGNAAPVDVRSAVQMMDDTISKMSNSGIKPPPVVREFKTWRGRLAGQTPDGNPTTLSDYESVLANWRAIRDRVDDLYKSGQGNVAEALKPVRDTLEQSLSESSDMFRTANAGYREASRVIDAVDDGRSMARPSTRADDNVARFGQMTPDQQGTARAGYGDEALKRVERNNSPTANRAKEVYGSQKSRMEADAMATDPGMFSERMGRENTMWETQNRALGGSRTADNQADQESIRNAAGGLLRGARSLANLNFGDAVANTGQALGPVFSGQNEATKKIIADALMSDDPVAAIGKAAISDQRKMALQLLLEGAIRGGSIRATGQ